MRWWWFGSAVTKPEIERELKIMKEGGIGGVEIQPVYPMALDDPGKGFRNIPYLSDEYLDALRFTSMKARELGLRMDVTLGSGWPFGGPHTPVTEAAGRLRIDRVPVPEHARSIPMPDITAGEQFIAAFLAKGDARQFSADGVRQVADIERGRLRLPAGIAGQHVVLFFLSSRSGMQVKRPAVGAEGFVLDHYSRPAIEHHLAAVGDRLMQAFGNHPPYSVFSDSLEVFASDWTPDLLSEFQKRRGYDLTPLLPALAGDFGERTAQVRRDWGKTLTELCDERYLTPLNQWAHKHGTKFRSQTYGTPPVTLSSNALVDLPEGEAGPHWRQFSTSRWASSASHLYGRPVTSSETWTWLHSPVFRATPLDMKAEADRHFLQGINQLIGHGWPYSPDAAGEPGWRFYAAAVFNHHNPWWIVMPDLTKYLQRISYLLRQGKPANDVAVYLPVEDARAQFLAGRGVSVDRSMETLLGRDLIPHILDAGFTFDFVDDQAIAKLGITHRVLVIPAGAKYIPAETQRSVDNFKAKGGAVIRVAEDRLGVELVKTLQPDFASGVADIGFIHRKLDDAEIYFIANTGNQAVHTAVAVRVKDLQPEWWDPSSGAAHAVEQRGGKIVLDLEPYESRVLIFSKNGSAAAPMSPPGRKLVDVSGSWKVLFAGLNRTVDLPARQSWTSDESTIYYSGTATYEKTISLASTAGPLFLNFGEGSIAPAPTGRAMGFRALLEGPVREAAQVYVNGKLAGSVWRPPYEIEITKLVHVGENQLRIVVGNLAVNTLAGQKLPDYKLLNLRYGERFTPQDMNTIEPLPSGLLGPVTILEKR